MKISLPLTIDNGHGEVITFKEILKEEDGDRLLLEGRVQPNCGPVMHVHFKQDEHFKVIQGTMAYQIPGQEAGHLKPGESVTFSRNQPHKFWNAGDEELVIDCWIKPVNNVVFYLSTLYEATKGQKTPQPEPFDGAYLIKRYASEYDIVQMPGFVKKVIIPITYFFGRLLGKYNKFKDAPRPM